MKGLVILTLLSVLVVSDYTFSQECPCETAELMDGTTGNDIIERACPGGELGEDSFFDLTQLTVTVGAFPEVYGVATNPDGGACGLGSIEVDTVTILLSLEEAQICRNNLIGRCNLKLINPIPTLSEWGLIAMAGLMGVVGLLVAARKRKAAA